MNSDFKKNTHNRSVKFSQSVREIVFGVEDGVVSTLGAITGIAVATGDQFVVVVSGLVIISVESISMGIGSYLSNKSVSEIKERSVSEEEDEINTLAAKEKDELEDMYVKEGWPKDMAHQMSEVASRDKKLMLREMIYRELKFHPDGESNNLLSGVIMFFSYIIGGVTPLMGYFIFSMPRAIFFSIVFAAVGLFLLGVSVSKYTNTKFWVAGGRILILGAISTVAGYIVGQIANNLK